MSKTVVTNEQFFELHCFIAGESNLLLVDAPCNVTVGDLKEAIHDKSRRTLDHVDAYKLDLWKVSASGM
jgi:Crinkler effector protein N-terminal domain